MTVRCLDCAVVSPIASLSWLFSCLMLSTLLYFRLHKETQGRLMILLSSNEIVQSTAMQVSYGWINSGVTIGNVCTAQGFFMNYSNVASALANASIGLYTVLFGVFNIDIPHYEFYAAGVSIGLPLVINIAALILGRVRNVNFYGPVSSWCWISADYPAYKIGFHYDIIWAAVLFQICLYTIMVAHIWWSHRQIKKQFTHSSSEQDRSRRTRIIRSLVWYPIVFLITFGPLSLVRTMEASGYQVLPVFTTISLSFWAANGFLSSLVYGITRNIYSRWTSKIPSRRNSSTVQSGSLSVATEPTAVE